MLPSAKKAENITGLRYATVQLGDRSQLGTADMSQLLATSCGVNCSLHGVLTAETFRAWDMHVCCGLLLQASVACGAALAKRPCLQGSHQEKLQEAQGHTWRTTHQKTEVEKEQLWGRKAWDLKFPP